MKLTQKTLFQCFDKSRPSSPISHSSQEISPYASQAKKSDEQQQIHACQPDFLLPIHIRQLDTLSATEPVHLLTTRRPIHDQCTYSFQQYFRPGADIDYGSNQFPEIKFTPICSTEHQTELFQQYTLDQAMVDWQSMFTSFRETRQKAMEQNQCEQLLWTDLYRPRELKTYLGNHTRQVKRLNEWFAYWTLKLQDEAPKKVEGKKRKRASDDDDDESTCDSLTDESNMSCANGWPSKHEHPQLIFIHGSGTTSLVHALAEEYNFKVTEINGSQSRARAPLLKQLEQITSHHHLSFKRCSSDTAMSQDERSTPRKELPSPLPAKKKAKKERGTIMSYFKGEKAADLDEEHKENHSRPASNVRNKSTACEKGTKNKLANGTNVTKRRSKTKLETPVTIANENTFLSSVHVEKTSLILFDEIETLTTDDHFWSCLKKLLETARKPIILTSNSRSNPEEAIINLSKMGDYELIHLDSHEPELVHCFLRLILLTEMFEVPSPDDLTSLVHACSNDVRRTISTLQFLAQSSAVVTDQQHPADDKGSDSIPTWQSSRTFDAMYYSRRGEQWHESPLGTLFDALTVKQTSDYERSRLVLADRSQNNLQRVELCDTFKLFMQEQEMGNIVERPSFYLDYRPFVRQICQNEQRRVAEAASHIRRRHSLGFRGCSLQWSDFEILSAGLD